MGTIGAFCSTVAPFIPIDGAANAAQACTVRITERNNQITGVVRLDNGKRVSRDEWRYFSTVDALFQRVEDLEASNPYQLTVEYSPKYG